mgnify:CR=1 FL=1
MPYRDAAVKDFFIQFATLVSFYNFLDTVPEHLPKILNLYYLGKIFEAFILGGLLGLRPRCRDT